VALHVVLGDGSINKRELAHQLDDLWSKAEADGENFWFILEGKANPTEADRDLVAWLDTNGIYYEVFVTDSSVSMASLYTDPEFALEEQDISYSEAVCKVLRTKPELLEDEDGNETATLESADILALWVNPDDDAKEDALLIEAASDAMSLGYRVFSLNGSMVEVELPAEHEHPAPEPEPEPEPAPEPEESNVVPMEKKKRSRSKKAEPEPEPDIVVEDTPEMPYTRAELEGLTDAELKAMVKGQGYTVGTREENIDRILGVLGEQEVEAVAPVVSDEIPSFGGSGTNTTYEVEGTSTTGYTTTTSSNYYPHTSQDVLVVIHFPTHIITKMVPASVAESL
jgi:outer membrane biosynthesis protein TonB